MEIHLIRHPRVAVDPQLCYGHSDVPLAEPAEEAAERLRPWLPERFRLFSSPSSRALALAQVLGQPILDERLKEMHFGQWELQPFESLGEALELWAKNPFGFQPPGGESAAEMAMRVLEWWQEARERHQDEEAIVIVAHGGPLRVLAGHLLGLPRERWLALDFGCAQATRIDLKPWGSMLRWFNRT